MLLNPQIEKSSPSHRPPLLYTQLLSSMKYRVLFDVRIIILNFFLQTERIFEGKSDGDNISNSTKENRGNDDEGSSNDFYENQSEDSQVATLKDRLTLVTQVVC